MKVNKLNESQEATVARILSSKNYPRGFKWLSNNGTSGEVNFNGVDYAFRKLDDGSYKVMTSAAAGWNWSETLFKDESLHENTNGFVKTRCSECGKVNRVEVNFPAYNKPFEDTKYTCSECGTENLLHDNHEYNDDGTLKEDKTMNNEEFFEMFIEAAKNAYIEIMGEEKWNSLTNKEKHDAVMMLAKGMHTTLTKNNNSTLKEDFETNVDVILFNSYGQEIDRRTFSEDSLKDGFRAMITKDEWEFQPGDTIRFEYTEHEYDEYDESINEKSSCGKSKDKKSLTERQWRSKIPVDKAMALRTAINEENYEDLKSSLIDIYKYINQLFPDMFDEDELSDKIDDINFMRTPDDYDLFSDEEDEDEFIEDAEDAINYELNELYDFCDNIGIWIPV